MFGYLPEIENRNKASPIPTARITPSQKRKAFGPSVSSQKIPAPAARTCIGPLPSADYTQKPQQQYCRHYQITVPRACLKQLRETGYEFFDLFKPFHNNTFKKTTASAVCKFNEKCTESKNFGNHYLLCHTGNFIFAQKLTNYGIHTYRIS